MSFIKKEQFTETLQTPQVRWNGIEGVFTHSVYNKQAGAYIDKAIAEAFVMDVHMARHGYESIAKGAGRQVKEMRPAHEDLAEQPKEGKWHACYVIPVYSNEIGGKKDIVFRGESEIGALAHMFDRIEKKLMDGDKRMVPVIEVETEDTVDFGKAPIFHIKGMVERPNWGTAIVDFSD